MPLRQASAALQDERAVPANGTGTTDLSLRLLDFLARSAEPVGLSELARQFQASKATIHRHLQTLAYHDFVRQDPATMRYAPGIKLFSVASRITNAARGTPATPFDVIINVSIITICRPKLIWPITGSAACATNTEAIAR